MNSATVAAIYTFCAHYHEGQGSRLYRLLCRAEKAWRRRTGLSPRLGYWESLVRMPSDMGGDVHRIYWQLVSKHDARW